MNSFIYTAAAVIATLVAVITLARAIRGARDKQVASAAQLSDALTANTGVTKELTETMTGVLDTQHKHSIELAKLGIRVDHLEKERD